MVLKVLDRLLARFRRRDLDREMDQEIRFHLERQIEQNLGAGMPAEEARRVALLDFGGALQVKEACRETRLTWLDACWQDVRYALRSFRRDRVFTATAILTLAIGIGATTSAFSIVDGILFKPLPYEDPGRVMMLLWKHPRTGQLAEGLKQEEFTALHRSRSFEAVASYNGLLGGLLTTTGEDGAARIRTSENSSDFLRVLGVRPILGRDFTPEDGRTGRVALLTHGLWQQQYGADPSIVGKALAFQEGPVTVAGVLPPDFWFPRTTRQDAPELLLASPVDWDKPLPRNEVHFLIGRLRKGVSRGETQAEAELISARAAAFRNEPHGEYGMFVAPLRRQMVFFVENALLIVMGAVLFLLLIACLNVANLLLVRGRGREREFAVRNSLGAGRWRLVRQMLTESLVLACIGGLIGVLLSYWTLDVLLAQIPESFLIVRDIGIDGRVLAFSTAITVVSVLVFGLVPALGISRPDIAASLKLGSRCAARVTRTRARGGLLVAEVAGALTLLVGAGLLVSSFVHLLAIDIGFDHRNVLTAAVGAPPSRYATEGEVTRFFEQAAERLQALPGVRAVATADFSPLSQAIMTMPIRIAGVAEAQKADTFRASRSYFATLGVRVLDGRIWHRTEEQGRASVAVVNETMARRFWPDGNAIGQRVVVWAETPVQIVGVVADTRTGGRDRATGFLKPANPSIYVPYDGACRRFRFRTFVLRTDPHYGDLGPAVKEAITSLDRNLVVEPSSLEETVDMRLATPWFHMFVFGLFAGIGLLLASVGIAGVAAHNVARSTHEIGVRLALGADQAAVVRLMTRQTMVPVIVGLVAGIAAAAALSRVLSSMLFDITPRDPATFLAVSALLAVVGLAACYLPARRAARVDPIRVLRAE